ncbi:hypothetical protein [Bailinhaonella thermotolerans]|uniref:Lipoprotein n=1 Tax=Bailinhaonella thermotolerans TaxID=1070861 RepID=A0A3A4A6W9_9ACTN|nr:hypothetical protein [Bailinhaonella thermotolerans]RJL22767.1 hypothetical protein D5H75_34830 [Bailinhaonella thermotolerans]
MPTPTPLRGGLAVLLLTGLAACGSPTSGAGAPPPSALPTAPADASPQQLSALLADRMDRYRSFRLHLTTDHKGGKRVVYDMAVDRRGAHPLIDAKISLSDGPRLRVVLTATHSYTDPGASGARWIKNSLTGDGPGARLDRALADKLLYAIEASGDRRTLGSGRVTSTMRVARGSGHEHRYIVQVAPEAARRSGVREYELWVDRRGEPLRLALIPVGPDGPKRWDLTFSGWGQGAVADPPAGKIHDLSRKP